MAIGGKSSRSCHHGQILIAHYKKDAIILRIDFPVWSEEKRRKRRAQSLVQENIANKRTATLPDQKSAFGAQTC